VTDRSTLDPEIQQSREELSCLLDDLIKRPLVEETQRIADNNFDQLKKNIIDQGGNLRRLIDAGFSTTNEELEGSIDKISSAFLSVRNEVIQTSLNTQQKLDGIESSMNSHTAGLVSCVERLTKLILRQHHQNTSSLEAVMALQNIQQDDHNKTIVNVLERLDSVKGMLSADREYFQLVRKEQSIRFKTMFGLLLLIGVGIYSVLFKLFIS